MPLRMQGLMQHFPGPSLYSVVVEDYGGWLFSFQPARSSALACLGRGTCRPGGTALGYKALVLYIKGDWVEFSSTLFFLSWSVATAPCIWCDSSVEDLLNFIGISPLGIGGGKRADDEE